MATPSALRRARKSKRWPTSTARQRRGGLVEDQHPRLLRGRLDDLGQLLLAGAEVGRPAASGRYRRRARRTARAPAAPAWRSSIMPKRSLASRVRKMFWATLSVGTRLISWKIIEMPARWPPRALCSVSGVPSTSIVPSLGHVHAVQDLEDRRFAGAVAAEQRMDLAIGDAQVDALRARGRRRKTSTTPVIRTASGGAAVAALVILSDIVPAPR